MSSTQENIDKELTHIKTALHHCQFPSWALNQWEHKFNHPQQAPASNTNHNISSNPNNSSNHKTTIVVPYIHKTAEKFKRLCKCRGIQVHFKGTNTSEQPWETPRTRTPNPTKQESSTSTNAHTSTVPVPTLGNLAGPWGKELRNILRPPPPYTFTAPPQDTPWTPTNLTLYTRRWTARPGPSRRLCLSMFRTPSQQKFGKISATAYMGSSATGLTNVPAQANTAANFYCQHITPPTGKSLPLLSFTLLLSNWVGALLFLILLFPMVSKCVHLKYPPPYLHLGLQQCHLGKFPL